MFRMTYIQHVLNGCIMDEPEKKVGTAFQTLRDYKRIFVLRLKVKSEAKT